MARTKSTSLHLLKKLDGFFNPESAKEVEIRFVMDRDAIDESLPNVHWVWLDLGVPDGSSNVQS